MGIWLSPHFYSDSSSSFFGFTFHDHDDFSFHPVFGEMID